ncbi:MAG: tetratricopeptide repeat protein, partial [Candidatus Hodarchaeota archaeon]
MDISKRIVSTFVIVALIPILIIAALSAMTVYDVSNVNAADAADELKAEELANLMRISSDTAAFIEERMTQYFSAVYLMEEYCEDLFNGRITATPQYSYFWDPTAEYYHSGRTIPGRNPATYDEDYESYDISFEVSCWYMPENDYITPSDPWDQSPTTQYFIDMTSNMDNVFRALHESSDDYIWLYMGFSPDICDTRLFRNYPYDNLEYFLDWYGPGSDYDPTREDWYTNAASIEDGSIAFTSPYGDPSTGLVISMGRPVHYDNGTLIGVVSADVTLDTILENVLGIEVLDSGYAYLLESNGGVVAHPDFESEGQTIYEVEFEGASSQEQIEFAALLPIILSENIGQTEFMKGGEEWYITHSRINSTGFVLAIVVPSAEVIAPATNILNLVLGQTFFLTLILGGVLAAVSVIVAMVSYRRGNAVVEPIREMTRLVEKMASQDFTRSVSTRGAMFEEVGTTVDALLSFQEACRFGNQAFIRGDLNRALANYQNLLEISQRLNIEVGIQTMYLNIGNVFRQRGDTGNAMDYYERALELAKNMLDRAKEHGDDETDALLRIASAYHNMALVEMDRGKTNKAISYLEDAEAIDNTLGHRRGLAKRYDAMGLALMREGRYSQAQSKFSDALKIAKAENYERSMAYIHFHSGELQQVQGNLKKAEQEYNDAIQLGQLAEEYWLVVYAMQNLADVLDQLDKPSHELRRKAEKLRRSIMFKKSVVFVIDYSGSMQAQNRIRAAVQGAKEILDSEVNPQDEVSIIVFNSSYRELLPLTKKGEYERS